MIEVEHKLQRRHEIVEELENEKLASAYASVKSEVGNMAKLQKLPVFQDGKDELDSYCKSTNFVCILFSYCLYNF